MYFTESSKIKENATINIRKRIFQNLRVKIDAQGNLQTISNLQKGFDVTFSSQGFYWYQSTFIIILEIRPYFDPIGYPGNNSQSQFQASGAYIFRPFAQTPQPVSTTRTV